MYKKIQNNNNAKRLEELSVRNLHYWGMTEVVICTIISILVIISGITTKDTMKKIYNSQIGGKNNKITQKKAKQKG